MPRAVGFNAIGWNEAPYAQSGYYAVSQSQSVQFHVTNQVSDGQAIQYDVTNPAGQGQDVAWDMRQIAADGQGVSFDVTNPISDAQAIVFDITHPVSPRQRCMSWRVSMHGVGGSSALQRVAGASRITRAGQSAPLSPVTPCGG